MYNVSFRIVGNSGDAEDVLQLSFIQAFKNMKDLKSNSKFSGWLKRIVINRSIDCLRKNDKLDIISLDEDNNHIHSSSEDFRGNYEHSNERLIREIKSGINKLAEGYRTVLSLYLLEGYTHREIAMMLQISEATSRTQYMRARIKLRDMVFENLNYQE